MCKEERKRERVGRGRETNDTEREGDPSVTMVRVGPTSTLRHNHPFSYMPPSNATLPLVPGLALHHFVLDSLSPSFPCSLTPWLLPSLSLSLLARRKPVPSINITLYGSSERQPSAIILSSEHFAPSTWRSSGTSRKFSRANTPWAGDIICISPSRQRSRRRFYAHTWFLSIFFWNRGECKFLFDIFCVALIVGKSCLSWESTLMGVQENFCLEQVRTRSCCQLKQTLGKAFYQMYSVSFLSKKWKINFMILVINKRKNVLESLLTIYK